MPRDRSTRSHVLYHPVTLRLRSAAHRASLSENEVAVLSGRDPKEFGSIGRMPGGRRIGLTGLTDAYPIHRASFYQRSGVIAGHTLRTTTAGNVTPGSSTNVVLTSSVGFAVGDYVAVIHADNCLTGNITAISGNTITVNTGTGGGSTTVIPAGAEVARVMPIFSGITAGATSVTTLWPFDLHVGMSVRIVGCRDGANSVETVQVKSIAGATVHFSVAAAASHSSVTCLVPVFSAYDYPEAFVSQSTSGNLYSIRAATAKAVLHSGSAPWRTAMYDRWVMAVNGTEAPRRIPPHSSSYDASVSGQGDPAEYIGFPDPPNIASPWSAVSASGNVTTGTHIVFVRLVDGSCQPNCKSPPIARAAVTILGALSNPAIRLNIKAVMNALISGNVAAQYRRATLLEIWMSLAGQRVYQLAGSAYLGLFVDPATQDWYTAYDLTLPDADLLLRNTLDPADEVKGPMPNGRFIHHQSGITYVAGASSASAVNTYPKVMSGNVVYFSRTDADEPENFPARNFKSVGDVGDEVRGFVKAGDSTIILCRSSYTIARRLGTFLQFFDDGGANQGCAYDEAYASLGSHAVWVSDESIWLHDGQPGTQPIDIGADIRDWVRGLHGASRVRVAYDSRNHLLYIGKIGSGANEDVAAEAMIYHFADNPAERAWTMRENLPLDAPFAGFGIESETSPWHLYRFGGNGAALFRAADYESEPIADGGFSLASNVMHGTLASNLSNATSLGGLTIPDGASNGFRGLVLHVLHADGSESVRIITTSQNNSVQWTTGLSASAGDKWTIGGIPFRLRFPPIRATNPFTVKTIIGAQVMLDNVRYGGQAAEGANLGIKLLSDLRTAPNNGASASILIASGAALLGRDLATKVEESGGILEVQVEQLDRHVDFSLIYAGLPINLHGVYGGDRNDAV